MSINKKTRFEVLKRDSFTCQYCGKKAPDVVLEIDHIQPKSKGGTDDILNLITACFDCNRGKKNKKLSDNAEINKKMNQLNILNKRKQQLEMLYEYQKELLNIEECEVNKFCDIFNKITCYILNENSKSNIKKYIKTYGFNEVVESFKISFSQYCNTINDDGIIEQVEIQESLKRLPLILKNRKLIEKKPYLKDLFYIRGILTNRRIINKGTVRYYNSIKILEKFYICGVTIEDIKEIALNSDSYEELEDLLENLINEIIGE